MTATTVAPPVTEPDLYRREPEVLARRSPSVKSSAESRRNASTIARQSSVSKHDASSHSQSSTLDSSNHHGSNGKRRSQESLARKASERRRVLRVGNYVIYRKTIGAGSMGKVKLAECLTDSDRQQYAVKIMPKVNLAAIADSNNTKAKDPKDTPKEREQRTVREMAMMQLLRHPNICQLKEWINEGDYYYMFLEYVDGGQLLDYIISHGKLREKQARKFARQIVSALDYCHRNSIVHRDLKIENILITRNEDIKIIDFGLSNIYSPSRLLSTFCGSLYFAAPELLQARHYTGPEVDVWSFGVVLYVLVCGRVPFDDTSLPALHAKIKAGQVDGYPDHLSKDCIDLLQHVLVVNPKRRYTLSQVRNHPWMNKGYDEPIPNHLPHRQPLESIDMDIVEGMGGFGFGEPREIYSKLEAIIARSDYQLAASQIDQNYQQQLLNGTQSSKPRWRRSLRNKRTSQIQDDPLSLPAMYDPLVSIYYLVKEKKEYDKRQKQLNRAQQTAAYSTPTLRRSNSTITARTRLATGETTLTRRKTDRAPSTPKLTTPETTNLSRSGSVNLPTRSSSTRLSSTLLSRSKSAARRLGAILPSNNVQSPRPSTDANEKVLPPVPAQDDNKPANTPTASASTPLKKTFQQFLKVDNNNSTNNNEEKKPRGSWRRLSINRGAFKYQRSSMEQAKNAEPIPPVPAIPAGRVSESGDEGPMPTLGAHPKSLFNFNRRHLFRSTPKKMMDDLNDLLWLMNIRTQQSAVDPFILHCECDYPDWLKFLRRPENMEHSTHSSRIDEPELPTDQAAQGEPLRFTVLIYQARWAGGRLGVKVKEAEDEASNGSQRTKIYRNLYHTILFELGKIAQNQQS